MRGFAVFSILKKNSFVSLVPLLLTLVFAASFSFFSCASSSVEPVDNAAGNSSDGAKKEETAEIWRKAASIADLTGSWKASDGSLYEYPFELNGKVYLRCAYPTEDDTGKWEDCAKYHFTSIDDLWAKKFSYVNEIYGKNYPLSDSNGTQTGYKFSCEKDLFGKISRINSRREWLIPAFIVERNVSFFQISNKGNLKEKGSFRMNSDIFDDLDSDGLVYSKFVDYWK